MDANTLVVLRMTLGVLLGTLVVGFIPDVEWTYSQPDLAEAFAEAEEEEEDVTDVEPEAMEHPEDEDGVVYNVLKAPLVMLFLALMTVFISHKGAAKKLHPALALVPYLLFLILMVALPDMYDGWTPDPYKTIVATLITLALFVPAVHVAVKLGKCVINPQSSDDVVEAGKPTDEPHAEKLGLVTALLTAQLGVCTYYVYTVCSQLADYDWIVAVLFLSVYPVATMCLRVPAMKLCASPDKELAVEASSYAFAAICFRWFMPDFTDDGVFIGVQVYLVALKLGILAFRYSRIKGGDDEADTVFIRKQVLLQYHDILSLLVWFTFFGLMTEVLDISPMHFEWADTSDLDDALDRLWLMYGVALVIEVLITALMLVTLGKKRTGGAQAIWNDGMRLLAANHNVLLCANLAAFLACIVLDGRRTLVERDVDEYSEITISWDDDAAAEEGGDDDAAAEEE